MAYELPGWASAAGVTIQVRCVAAPGRTVPPPPAAPPPGAAVQPAGRSSRTDRSVCGRFEALVKAAVTVAGWPAVTGSGCPAGGPRARRAAVLAQEPASSSVPPTECPGGLVIPSRAWLVITGGNTTRFRSLHAGSAGVLLCPGTSAQAEPVQYWTW